MSLVHNEQTKLSAAWFNTLATALVTAGTFAPFAGFLYGFMRPDVSGFGLMLIAVACLVGGMALHFGGRLLLKGLRE